MLYVPAPTTRVCPTPGKPGQFVLQIDRGIVAQKQAVEAFVGRSERDEEHDVGRLLLRDEAFQLHLRRQLRQRRSATRFCTNTWSMSVSVPTSNVTVSVYEPSLAEVDDM